MDGITTVTEHGFLELEGVVVGDKISKTQGYLHIPHKGIQMIQQLECKVADKRELHVYPDRPWLVARSEPTGYDTVLVDYSLHLYCTEPRKIIIQLLLQETLTFQSRWYGLKRNYKHAFLLRVVGL